MNKFKFSCIVCLAYVIFEVRYAILGYFMHLTPNTIMQKRKRKCNAREGGQNMVVGYKGKWLYKRRACRLTPIIIGAWVRNDECMLYLFCVFERVYLKRILFFFRSHTHIVSFKGELSALLFKRWTYFSLHACCNQRKPIKKYRLLKFWQSLGLLLLGKTREEKNPHASHVYANHNIIIALKYAKREKTVFKAKDNIISKWLKKGKGRVSIRCRSQHKIEVFNQKLFFQRCVMEVYVTTTCG